MVLLSSFVCAQKYSTPSSYTPYLGLRNYAIGANIGNGINLNNQTIDTWAQSINTIQFTITGDSDWYPAITFDNESDTSKYFELDYMEIWQ